MHRVILVIAFALGACATAGSTLNSGVGDRQLEHPPWYAGQKLTSGNVPLVPFAIQYQRGASQAEIFDPDQDADSPVSHLLREMTAFMDSVLDMRAVVAPAGSGLLPPNVVFGCERDASNDCVERGDSVLGRQGTTMRLAVERPSRSWIAQNALILDSNSATHSLVLTLEVGQYWPRQTGLRGAKSVELGVGHVVPLPWLTSLETPVSVLQLTGSLINREGQAVRIGAEGLIARQSPLVASAMGARALIVDEDVQRLRTLRRADKRGQPLVWQAAVCELLSELAGRSCDRPRS